MNKLLMAVLLSFGFQVPESPVELGRVKFLRSIDQGLARAKTEGRPVFTLFQEIPG